MSLATRASSATLQDHIGIKIEMRSSSSSKTYFHVLGPTRGGTTLLANCLDSHPNIRCFNEAADDTLRGKTGWRYVVLRRMAQVPVLSRLAAVLERHADKHAAAPSIRRGVSLPAGVRRASQYYAEIHGLLSMQVEPVAGNKITTERLSMIYRPSYRRCESLSEGAYERVRQGRLSYFCNSLFNNYWFVFIVRDGRRVVTSQMRRLGLQPSEAARRWLDSARIHRSLFQLLGDRMLTLTFEDLVSNPETTLRRVCEFLNADFNSQMLTGANRAYKNERHQGFDQEKIEATGLPEYESLLREGLAYFNYPMPPN